MYFIREYGSISCLIIHLILQIIIAIRLIFNIRNKKSNKIIIILEIIMILISGLLCYYFETIPGIGKAPGLTYASHFFINFGALFIYAILLIITLLLSMKKC